MTTTFGHLWRPAATEIKDLQASVELNQTELPQGQVPIILPPQGLLGVERTPKCLVFYSYVLINPIVGEQECLECMNTGMEEDLPAKPALGGRIVCRNFPFPHLPPKLKKPNNIEMLGGTLK